MATYTGDPQGAAAVVDNLEKVPLETISLDGFTSRQILTYRNDAYHQYPSKENPITFPCPAADLNDPNLLYHLRNSSSLNTTTDLR